MQVLHEAQIILPATTAGGDVRLNEALVLAFGGVTLTEGSGSWRGPDGRVHSEAVHIYSVAVAKTTENGNRLLNLARQFGILLDQLAVYLKLPNGEVRILERGKDYA